MSSLAGVSSTSEDKNRHAAKKRFVVLKNKKEKPEDGVT